jgi:NitT/TauT family transport system substrate-binding protein
MNAWGGYDIMRQRRPFGGVWIGLAALALAGGASLGLAQTRQKVTVALGGDGLQIAAVHIANGGGFFKEEGIDIEFVDVNSGPRQAAALMGGSALFAPLGLIHSIKINSEGGNLVAMAAMTNVIDLHIIVSKAAIAKSGLAKSQPIDERVRRMQGLKIGITSPGSTTDTGARVLFKARGFDPDTYVQLVPLGGGTNMLASFEKGLVDGFVWSAPQPQVAVQKGLGEIIIDPFDLEAPESVDIPYQVMVVNKSTMKANEELLSKSVRALTKGYKFARENPDKALVILQARFPEFDKEILAKVWPNYQKGLPATPVISLKQFTRTQEWLNITAAKKYDTKFDAVVSSEIAERAAKDIIGN